MFLAEAMSQKYDENKLTVDGLAKWSAAGLIALGLEIVFLIADLATR